VLVVESFEELDARALEGRVDGRIVLFNPRCDWGAKPVGCYGETTK
jgi:hypothetical protein